MDKLIIQSNPDSQDVHVDAISKPEVTENYVRIPVHDCKITATIDIDKEHGIKALYCGQDKQIATYLFPKDSYSMSEAEAWVKEHKKSKSAEKMQKSFTVPIAKMDDEKHLIYGIVLEPDMVDTQDDMVSVEEIEKACHKFMRESQVIFREHKDKEPACEVVENYIAPDNFKMGEGEVKKGSWVMVTFCGDEELWGQVKKGEITGYSIRGYANRQ